MDLGRVGPGRAQLDLDGVAPAGGGGAVEVEIGGVRDPALKFTGIVLRSGLDRELVEGSDGGERPLEEGKRDAVVDDVEEAEGSRGGTDLVDDGGAREGEIDGGDRDLI